MLNKWDIKCTCHTPLYFKIHWLGEFTQTWAHLGCEVMPGDSPQVTVWCAGCGDNMKEGIKSFQTKVKASKSDKQFQSYRHFKIGYILWVLSVMSKVYHAARECRSAACAEISRQPCSPIITESLALHCRQLILTNFNIRLDLHVD